MKWGFAIAAVIVLFFGFILFLSARGFPDPPTRATTATGALDAITLETGLPPVAEHTGSGDGASSYKEAFAIYQSNRSAARSNAVIDQLTEHLIDAMQAPKADMSFLDEGIPLQPGGKPDYGDALEVIPELVLSRAADMRERGDYEYARRAEQAVWVMGERCFGKCKIHYPREIGLNLMIAACEQMYSNDASLPNGGEVDAWIKPLQQLRKDWLAKSEVVLSLRPHIGDLMNVAQYDKDVSFRVAATLQMGIRKFSPGSNGNYNAMIALLEQLKSDSDPLVAKAAEAAAAFEKSKLQTIR